MVDTQRGIMYLLRGFDAGGLFLLSKDTTFVDYVVREYRLNAVFYLILEKLS